MYNVTYVHMYNIYIIITRFVRQMHMSRYDVMMLQKWQISEICDTIYV